MIAAEQRLETAIIRTNHLFEGVNPFIPGQYSELLTLKDTLKDSYYQTQEKFEPQGERQYFFPQVLILNLSLMDVFSGETGPIRPVDR